MRSYSHAISPYGIEISTAKQYAICVFFSGGILHTNGVKWGRRKGFSSYMVLGEKLLAIFSIHIRQKTPIFLGHQQINRVNFIFFSITTTQLAHNHIYG